LYKTPNLYLNFGVYWYDLGIMKAKCWLFFLGFLILFTGCDLEDDKLGLTILTQTFDFDESDHAWQHGFSDYPAGPEDSIFFELKYAYSDSIGRQAIMLSGNNHSDDLFMFLKKKITGLRPNTNFTLTFEVAFASNAKQGTVGPAGAPGENVYLKVGATSFEPKPVIDQGMYVMNLDKGELSQGGEDMIPIGNVAVPPGTEGFINVTRTNTTYNGSPFEVTSNDNGEVWLIVGTDSGYEGVTTLFYTSVYVALSSSN
jgi:hypothetical protein